MWTWHVFNSCWKREKIISSIRSTFEKRSSQSSIDARRFTREKWIREKCWNYFHRASRKSSDFVHRTLSNWLEFDGQRRHSMALVNRFLSETQFARWKSSFDLFDFSTNSTDFIAFEVKRKDEQIRFGFVFVCSIDFSQVSVIYWPMSCLASFVRWLCRIISTMIISCRMKFSDFLK